MVQIFKIKKKHSDTPSSSHKMTELENTYVIKDFNPTSKVKAILKKIDVDNGRKLAYVHWINEEKEEGFFIFTFWL